MSEMQDAQVDREVETELRLEHPSIEAVYREHGGRLWRSVYLYAGDRDVASDAVAEAFAQAIRRGQGIRDPMAWITKAAFRIAAGELQDRRQLTELALVPSDDVSEGAVSLLFALRALPDRQRAAVVLRYYGGYSHGEIGEMLGSTTSAIAVSIHRAKRRLLELMETTDD